MNPFSLRKTASFLIVIIWFVTMSMLLSRHYGLFRTATLPVSRIDPESAAPFDIWMGVYYRGDRVGSLHRVMHKDGEGFLLSEQMRLRLTLMEFQKEIESVTNVRFDRRLGLEKFDFSLKADAPIHVFGKVAGGKLMLTMEAGGRRSESSLPLDDVFSLTMSPAQDIFREGITEGMKKSVAVFDPLSMSRQKVSLEVTGREKLIVMGKSEEVYRVAASMGGTDYSIWVTGKGDVLKEESPLGFTLIREGAGEATDIRPSRDMISGSAVPFNLRLPDEVSFLKVRISGVELKGLDLDGGRQNLGRDIIEISREDLASRGKQPGRQLDEAPGQQYLRDSFFVSSRDAKIIALSKEIVREEKDPVAAARHIYEWVFRNIEKVPAVTLPVATEVLGKRRGDCNEHTALYAALARAAGIPTRIALGLTYRQGYFYYHAWPEVYAGQWIAVDPTLGQFPADAAHIRLITGDIDSQARILPILGRIRLEGLSYR